VSDNNQIYQPEAGFTLTELLIVTTVMALISVVFLGILSSFYTTINRNNQRTEMTISSQNVLRATVEHLRFGDGIRQTNQISDANAPSGGWNTSNTSFVVILAVPAVDSGKNYIIDPATGSPYMNELVYYKNGTTLMERKLANPNATGNTVTTSCPAASASPSCPADVTLANYVKSMLFTLYDQNDATTTVVANARSININLDMERDSLASKPIQLTTSIRVTLRNRF
jgi:prepilin-type N-terminal cleavage/methylation domain-containing protein